MRDGDWIAMPGVPQIAAGSPEAAAGVEGDGANAPGNGARAAEEATGPAFDDVRVDRVLTVNSCIKVYLDLQADKSPVVVKGPFFLRVVNPRYRIRGTMCNARIQSSKVRKSIL
jgi:hypothetical protein